MWSETHQSFRFPVRLSCEEIDIAVVETPHGDEIVADVGCFDGFEQYEAGVAKKEHIVGEVGDIAPLVPLFHADQRLDEVPFAVLMAFVYPRHVKFAGISGTAHPDLDVRSGSFGHVQRVQAQVNAAHVDVRCGNLFVQPGPGHKMPATKFGAGILSQVFDGSFCRHRLRIFTQRCSTALDSRIASQMCV